MNCLHPLQVRKWAQDQNGKSYKTNNFHLVPCGHCVVCLSRRRNEWTYRLSQEQFYSSYSYFVTLTYDLQHIPKRINDGKPYFVFSKSDCQKYLKRCRHFILKVCPEVHFTYYLVSEYGSKTHRPHYHLLLFVKNDKYLKYKRTLEEIIRGCWQNGFVTCKPADRANIHYCTKYVMKGIDGMYVDTIDEPFVLCSKKAYLGSSAESLLQKSTDAVVFDNGARLAMPRIYRNKTGIAPKNCDMHPDDPRYSLRDYESVKRMYMRQNRIYDPKLINEEHFADFRNKKLFVFEMLQERRFKNYQQKL